MAQWNIGDKNGMWKGGRSLASNGYVLIRVGKDHHLADVRGYAYEHRLVAEQILGRRLLQGEIPHHVNGDKADNRPGNIEVLRSHAHHRAEHRKPGSGLQGPDEENTMVACACGCGNTFWKYDATGRPRDFISGHNAPRREPPAENPLISCGCGCGALFSQFTATGYERTFKQGHRPRSKFNRQPQEENPQIACACGCGERLSKFDQSGRPRRFVSGHNAKKGDVQWQKKL